MRAILTIASLIEAATGFALMAIRLSSSGCSSAKRLLGWASL